MRWKILISSLLLFVSLPALGQDRDTTEYRKLVAQRVEELRQREMKRVNRQIERERRQFIPGKEDYVFLSFGTPLLYFGEERYYKVEYSRQIENDLYWGTTFTTLLSGDDTANNGVDIYKLSGMFYYRAPVVHGRLYFRLGVGLGVAVRQRNPYYYSYTEQATYFRPEVLPYFDFEAAWILRVHRNIELKFAAIPYLLPSEVALSLMRTDGGDGGMGAFFGPGGLLRLGLTVGGRF